MTYFADLSVYTYTASSRSFPIRNVGWLDAGHSFPTSASIENLLAALWPFCLLSFCPQRGGQHCPFCKQLGVVERDGKRYVLGAAELRVFDHKGEFPFAAPNLVYHYVEAHHYLPPAEFLEALRSGPQPQTEEYRALVAKLGSKWWATAPTEGAFRFVKRGDEVVREWIVEPSD